MPLPIIAEGLFKGLSAIPYSYQILRTLPWLVGTYLLRSYFGGASCRSERNMHSKVIMITGGTTGIGASVALELAQRGAQIVLLTREPPSDPFVSDFVERLRETSDNSLIYAEQADLASLHSIRQFATRWIDNAPPRRLDMIILCAATMKPKLSPLTLTEDDIEETWAVNYLANFHLLSILSPAIRAQPSERDVRIVFATCSSYLGGKLGAVKEKKMLSTKHFDGGQAYSDSKLALMTFAHAFQKHLNAYVRPDKQPNGARVVMVDPGWTRTPGMRRWLSMGTLWGLLLYLITWPVWWLVLKSSTQGAQSFLTAAMNSELGMGAGGRFIKECREIGFMRSEVTDDKVAAELWKTSESQIQDMEKQGAKRRAAAKKDGEAREGETVSDGQAKDSASTIRESKIDKKSS